MIAFPKRSIALILLVSAIACREPVKSVNSPVEAKDALATYKVADGFKIEMIAAEPLVTDPVDMEIDEYGRMYVSEMHGYPLDKSGSGNIILLSDTNSDGVMDKRTVFKEGLMLPSSIMRWKKGILVTDSPNILYLEDTDGDGHANITDTVIHGFALTNPQHNANSSVYGIDNWIYIAHEGAVSTRTYKEEFGDEGSTIIFPGETGADTLPQNANGRSIRFRPDRKSMEMMSNRCQFGQTFDKWGHWFGCDNSNQGYQEVVANRYFERNPDLSISGATQDMSDHLNAAEVFPATLQPDRQILTDVGVMTSACGLTAYLGDAFPAPYNENVTFVAEPVSNLVHVDVLKDTGASFTASRILKNQEFLASTDAWARPVNFYVGPDGEMYVLDYYRKVIESPEWMSDEAIKAGGLYDGSDKGRIFKITAINKKNSTAHPKLGDASVEELVKVLANSNYWFRINAQRLLVDKNSKDAVPPLIAMTGNESAMGRLHALWTLEGMDALKEEQIELALRDSVAGIRENAIKLAELHLKQSPGLGKSLLALQTDNDPKVRFQLLLTLGYVNSPASAMVRKNLLFKDISDKWVQVAALSAPPSQTQSLMQNVLSEFREDVPAYASLVEKLAAMTGRGAQTTQIHELINKATMATSPAQPAKQSALLQGLALGIRSEKSAAAINNNDQQKLVATFFNNPVPEIREASLKLLKVKGITDTALLSASIRKAVLLANDSKTNSRKRAEAIHFISLTDPSPYSKDLEKLIDPAEENIVQIAAISTLGEVDGPEVSKFVISKWPLLTPEIRNEAIRTFMQDSARISLLIEALEKNKINPGSVDFPTSVELMQNDNKNLRARARTIFTRNAHEGKKINESYKDALELAGNVENGKKIYTQNCAICHQLRGKIGVQLGPDLGTVHNWTKQDIMANILDPNLSIASGFDMWEVELINGEKAQGIISGETPAAITLKNNGKPDRTVNRQEIKQLRALATSAMPVDLQKAINHQQMADLLSFLRQN